jgi:hypothetical protein
MMKVAPATDRRELSAEEVDVVSGARGCIYNPLADGPFSKWVGEKNDWLPGGGMRGPTFSEQVNDWLSRGRGTF